MRVVEPLRTSVVEIGQRPLPEFLLRRFASCDRAFREPRDRFVHPLDPFGGIQPSVPQFDQSLRSFRDGGGPWFTFVFRSRDVRRQPRGNGKVPKVVVGV